MADDNTNDNDTKMSRSEAGRKGAEAQPHDAKVKGGEKSPTSGSTDAARHGGENSHSSGHRSNNE